MLEKERKDGDWSGSSKVRGRGIEGSSGIVK